MRPLHCLDPGRNSSLVAFLLTLLLAAPLVAQTHSQAIVRLLPAAEGWRVSLDGKASMPLKDLAAGVLINGVQVTPPGAEGMASVTAAERDVVLEVEGFKDWTAQLPKGQALQVRPNPKMQWLDAQTPSENTGEVTLNLPDGARAVLRGASSARFDLFKDGSYYLAGRGRITATDADGLSRELSPFVPPMVGGPLQRTSANGKSAGRLQRLTPLLEVAMGGKADSAVEIYIGKQRYTLNAQTPQVVELPNGTQLELAQNPGSRVVEWRLRKGMCRVWVAGFDCWSAFLISEQSLGSLWNLDKGAVDTANTTATNLFPTAREVLVRIANRFSASVPGGTTFQYINVQNCSTFVASADGPVDFFNPISRQITRIGSESSATFRSGVVAASPNAPFNSITMNWDDGGELRISGTAGDFKVAPKTRQVLRGDNDSQLAVNYTDTGLIEIQSVSSAYQIDLRPLKDWQVRMGEGDGLGVIYDSKTGVFYGTANPANSAPVVFQTPEGYAPQVNPGGMITVITTQGGALPSRLMGSVVFYEQAGVGGGTVFGSAVQPNLLPVGAASLNTFGHPNNMIDPSRVPQPGASVVGGK
ncbi:MAG: hypothetical protein N3J91_01160 [Verrucomicrobiae bacterium]|nr:hypothetical protein [Verrucomicrobiae bacterium]